VGGQVYAKGGEKRMTTLLDGKVKYQDKNSRIGNVHSRIRRDGNEFIDIRIKSEIPMDEDGEYLFHKNRIDAWFSDQKEFYIILKLMFTIAVNVYFTSLVKNIERKIREWENVFLLRLRSRYRKSSRKKKVNF
jgi:hypothetical protein